MLWHDSKQDSLWQELKNVLPVLEERANLRKPCRLHMAVCRLICKRAMQFPEQGQGWFSMNAGVVSLNVLYNSILQHIASKFGISLQTQDLWDLIRVHDPPNWWFRHLMLLRTHGLTNYPRLTSYSECHGGATEGSSHFSVFSQAPQDARWHKSAYF